MILVAVCNIFYKRPQSDIALPPGDVFGCDFAFMLLEQLLMGV
jgi:hypothetical protein